MPPVATAQIVGVLGALEVVDEGAGGVLPHERTTPKASTDRLDLTRATNANLSPIWGLSLAGGLTELLTAPAEPVGSVTVDGVEHSVERVTDPERVAAIARTCRHRDDVLIADGHHRYAISRTYRDEIRAATGSDDTAAELTLAFVSELVAEQLSVAAIHRVYRGVDRGALIDALGRGFSMSEAGPVGRQHPGRDGRRGALCLVDSDGTGTWLDPRPGAFDDVRALDGAWLEHLLAGTGVDVAVSTRRRRVDRARAFRPTVTAGRADQAGECRRDRAHRPRGTVDAAQVDVLHPQAAHRACAAPARLIRPRRGSPPRKPPGSAPHACARHAPPCGRPPRSGSGWRRRPGRTAA